MNYTTEVEFLRAEVEKCHASMHSQIETINLLMKRNIELKQKSEWVGLTDEDRQELAAEQHSWEGLCFAVEDKLKEKNT